jgi:hypothetical protein
VYPLFSSQAVYYFLSLALSIQVFDSVHDAGRHSEYDVLYNCLMGTGMNTRLRIQPLAFSRLEIKKQEVQCFDTVNNHVGLPDVPNASKGRLSRCGRRPQRSYL